MQVVKLYNPNQSLIPFKFGALPQWCSGTALALCLGVTPTELRGTMWCQGMNPGLQHAKSVLRALGYLPGSNLSTISSFSSVQQLLSFFPPTRNWVEFSESEETTKKKLQPFLELESQELVASGLALPIEHLVSQVCLSVAAVRPGFSILERIPLCGQTTLCSPLVGDLSGFWSENWRVN